MRGWCPAPPLFSYAASSSGSTTGTSSGWELLAPAEKRALAWLSVMEGFRSSESSTSSVAPPEAQLEGPGGLSPSRSQWDRPILRLKGISSECASRSSKGKDEVSWAPSSSNELISKGATGIVRMRSPMASLLPAVFDPPVVFAVSARKPNGRWPLQKRIPGRLLVEMEKPVVAKVNGVAADDTPVITNPTKPGKYVFLCTVPGHAEGGMEGEVTVK